MLALRLFAGDFAQQIITGGHVNSLQALQEGRADICAIDAICVALARQHRPHLLKDLKLLGRSPLVPGLPFVTSLAHAADIPAIQKALHSCMADKRPVQARRAMHLKAFRVSFASEYERICEIERALP
jgi:ABC-type phosphate/phosphonate transport system substrate-binding protein